ncbi:hypothetical protein DCCM_0440 [Desulfocucumis palustris]|uniref:Uncharacterized protein n=1 Tax=Desulfocucumis palustris TaxID=1898651 RepID=A0A2L2X818_9FIRM|nr:hypothetical protein DCCM_0440 [Desulfocucumis palustris]
MMALRAFCFFCGVVLVPFVSLDLHGFPQLFRQKVRQEKK